jgi:ubiquinone/menaquinone biosynthesis C-methylase UbiE
VLRLAAEMRVERRPDAYFQTRFTHDTRRDVLWRTLWQHHFSKFISEGDCVLELGAGYGHFINHVTAKRRIAVDSWDGFLQHLQSGVEGRVGNVTDLSFLEPSSVDFVFASNLFEHISQDDFASVLCQLKRIMTGRGTLNVLQPNYYYAYREYFDDYTHRTVYTHTSMVDFLQAHGYRVIECQPRFLPLTLKSRLPVSPLLIRLYLSSPWKPAGKQMFIRAGCESAESRQTVPAA